MAKLMTALGCLALSLAGCGAYELRGTVVRGPEPGVRVVEASDARLNEPGLAGAVVELSMDPQSLGTKPVGSAMTDAKGQFAIPVKEFGAGVLEYDFGLLARMKGHRDVWQEMRLPGSSQRLLIVLSPGQGTRIRPGDALRDALRDAERLENQ